MLRFISGAPSTRTFFLQIFFSVGVNLVSDVTNYCNNKKRHIYGPKIFSMHSAYVQININSISVIFENVWVHIEIFDFW